MVSKVLRSKDRTCSTVGPGRICSKHHAGGIQLKKRGLANVSKIILSNLCQALPHVLRGARQVDCFDTIDLAATSLRSFHLEGLGKGVQVKTG